MQSENHYSPESSILRKQCSPAQGLTRKLFHNKSTFNWSESHFMWKVASQFFTVGSNELQYLSNSASWWKGLSASRCFIKQGGEGACLFVLVVAVLITTECSAVFSLSFYYSPVLVLAGMQLIFFTVAGVLPRFEFRMGITLTTQRCFSCCRALLHRADDVSASGAGHSEGTEGAQGAGIRQNLESWPRRAKGIYHNIWCDAEQ